MQGVKRSKLKKVTNIDRKYSRKSIKSDNLHVPLTPSTFRKIKTSTSRPSTAKSRSRVLDQRKSVGEREPLVRLSHARPSEVPANVAVHFASFYQNQNQGLPHSTDEKPFGVEAAKTSRNFPKMEFTRQMVYKLEHSAGTQHYGRQVSAVLEDTVESPGFNLKLPPVDNCAPSNKRNDHYPLWYRDPNKIPRISPEQLREVKDKYRYKIAANELGEGIRKVKESISDSSETEVEVESETESEENGGRFPSLRTEANMLRNSSKSNTSTENKSIPCSSSEDCSWSSRSGSDDAEEESLDWETEVEEEDGDVEAKVVNKFRKISVLDRS